MTKNKIIINSVFGSVIWESKKETLSEAVKEKYLRDANLRDADLYGADLYGANLCDANLRRANLRDADLRDADLRDADLYGANLCDANLRRANLYDADLRDADLRDADLYGANLCGANLCDANLRGADLRGADLRDANLRDADLYDADLRDANLRVANLCGAKNAELPQAYTVIVPEGDLIGWKKCTDGVIVKLRIPSEAKRSNATGRKCRAEYAEVLEIIGKDKRKKLKEAVSQYDKKFIYRVGETVRPSSWSEDRFEECAGGIHFFITRIEAESYT
jgi:hypothetical protein